MSQSAETNEGGKQSAKDKFDPDNPYDWTPADEYDGYYALLSNGKYRRKHVVDTTTFDNHAHAPADYRGHTASIGEAESLCGRELFGRMIPLEQENQHINGICGTCLRSLRNKEVLD